MRLPRGIPYPCSGRALALCVLILLAPKLPAAKSFEVICAPDKPLAHVGESIEVRAWAVDSRGNPISQPMDWFWNASAGEIDGAVVAVWRFDPLAAPDKEFVTHTATVTAQGAALGRADCEVHVTVTWPTHRKARGTRGVDLGAERLSGRSFLLPTATEPKGYGLYSYLLFGSPPSNDIERARYLSAIQSYLQQIQPIEEMERYVNRSQLNLATLPLKRPVQLPESLTDPDQLERLAVDVLDVYDYARAQLLLAQHGPKGLRSGPYLVSAMPEGGSSEHAAVLHFNLSRVVPALIPDWLRTFSALASQESSWTAVTLSKLALHTRNALAVASRDTPEVIAALSEWIKVLTLRK